MLKKMILLVTNLIALSTTCLSQQTMSKSLYPFESGEKCGYIDRQGQVVVAPQFDFCRLFDEGMAGVSTSKKSGYIDETGQIAIPLKFEGFFPQSFSEGFAKVEVLNMNGGIDLGFIDKRGKFYHLPNVSEIYSFYDGLAKVKKNGKFGYIDISMQFVIPPQFKFAGSFGDGIARVSNRPRKDFYIDKSGQRVLTNYDADGGNFSGGLATFKDKYLGYGYMDTTGQIVIKPQFRYACFFKHGLACAEANGKWGYIDIHGDFMISPQFDDAEDFSSDGVAVVKVGMKYGFINKKGEFVVSPQFDKAEWLDGLGFVETNGVQKYINEQGKTIWVMRRNEN